MYYVYRLTLNGCVYVGCTDNIQRRKCQHNENARKCKSKLGRFLNENEIILTNDDFIILKEFKDRPQALEFERNTAKLLEAKGARLLNDNFSRECTRKGKNIGNTAKEYVVVDCLEHTATYVHDLRQYCIKKGWNYSLVHRTVHNGKYCKYRCKAFFVKDWEREPMKEKYLSGEYVNDVLRDARAAMVKKSSKLYEVSFPDGHTEIIKNADKFAREHNLTSGTLHATLINGRPTKGYQLLRRI